MITSVYNVKQQKFIPAIIESASFSNMPLKKNGWQFNWRQLFKVDGTEIYKLVLTHNPNAIEGLIMLSLMNGEMMYMNNIEIAPYNIGPDGKHDHVAGSLIAFACQQSFERGKNKYMGYLSFESKTKLIPLYQQKYKASLAIGNRMYIGPNAGIELIKQYLENNGDTV